MSAGKVYDLEYKIQAVKLANEIGQAKAATELGIPRSTVYTWIRMVRLGRLDLGEGMHTPKSAMTLNEELIQLRQQVKVQESTQRQRFTLDDFIIVSGKEGAFGVDVFQQVVYVGNTVIRGCPNLCYYVRCQC